MSASDFITLRNGPTLPTAVLRLALDLEARGFTLTLDHDDLLVRPGGRLTPVDCDEIRRWKRHLLALLAYVPPEIQ